MGIFSRTRDIVAANITDLLDKAEDPAKMIRMIILEMEETLVEVRASAARTIADQKEMRRQITKLERLQESWVEKELRPAAKKYDQADEYPHGIVEQMKELGLFGATIGEAYGGLGLSAWTYAQIVIKVAGAWMAPSGIFTGMSDCMA